MPVSCVVGGSVVLVAKLNAVGCSKCDVNIEFDEGVLALKGTPARLTFSAGILDRRIEWKLTGIEPGKASVRLLASGDCGTQIVQIEVEVQA